MIIPIKKIILESLQNKPFYIYHIGKKGYDLKKKEYPKMVQINFYILSEYYLYLYKKYLDSQF